MIVQMKTRTNNYMKNTINVITNILIGYAAGEAWVGHTGISITSLAITLFIVNLNLNLYTD